MGATTQVEESAIGAMKVLVSAQLGVGIAHLSDRFDRLANTIAARVEQDPEYGQRRLCEMTVRDLCLVLAEGPDQQARALMLPEEVHPCLHQGCTGLGERVQCAAPVAVAAEGESGREGEGENAAG